MLIHSFNIPIIPIPKGRPRVGPGYAYTPKQTKDYEQSLGFHIARHRDRFKGSFLDPLSITLHFFLPRPQKTDCDYPVAKPDLDNLTKAVLDAMNGLVFKDDCQIISLKASKRYHDTPGIDVYIESHRPQTSTKESLDV